MVWVIPSLIFDIYIPVFLLIGGGGRFYNASNPGKSLGFSRNIILLEALKTFPQAIVSIFVIIIQIDQIISN